MAKTALPKRYKITPELLQQIEKHCYSTLDYEVGGMLFGKVTATATQINGFVPALKASKEAITLTFTHEVWDAILKEGEEKFPGQQIVGWYHTHPSFGIFLSDYDKFIQTQFFSQKGQVALVVDPVAGKLGWFETAGEDVKQIAADLTSTGPKQKREGQIPAGSKKRPSYLALGLASAGALGVGLGLGLTLSAAQTPPDLSGTVTALENRLAEIEMGLGTFQLPGTGELADRLTLVIGGDGSPVAIYLTQEGDTAESIALALYGSPDFVQQLVDSNQPGLFDALVPGTQVLVPNPTQLVLQLIPPTIASESATVSPSTSEQITESPTLSDEASE